MEYGLLFLVGLVAGGINVFAGGGSAFTLPLLIFLGLEGPLANGTNRVAILIQNMLAVWGFNQEGYEGVKEPLTLALFTIPGGLAGAFFAATMKDHTFRLILSLVIIFVILSMLIPRDRLPRLSNPLKKGWLYFFLFLIGFYGGFIQAGVGFLIMAVLYHLAHYDLVKTNWFKVIIVGFYTVPALFIFAWHGKVDWFLGFSLAAGNGLGGWIAARVSVRNGEKIIKRALMVALLVIAVKLLMQ